MIHAKTNRNPKKDFIKRKMFIKMELRRLILKSIIRSCSVPLENVFFNKNIFKKDLETANHFSIEHKNLIRQLASNKISCLVKYNKQITKQLNCCLMTGKQKTTRKISNLNRWVFKQFLDLGFIQNIKRKH